MRRLLPTPRDEPLEDLYLELAFPEPPVDRPYLYLDMVASVDGAATAGGRTADLGDEADGLAFSRLREWCDVILVGASTAYRGLRTASSRSGRPGPTGGPPFARGARIVVVTASCTLNPGSRLFSDPSRRPLVLTTEEGSPERLAGLSEVADVLRIGAVI